MNCLFCHFLIGTGQGFQCFIRVRIAFPTQYSLDSLSYDRPRVFKILLQLLLMENQLPKSLQSTLNSYDAMPHWHTNITQHGGVGKITL